MSAERYKKRNTVPQVLAGLAGIGLALTGCSSEKDPGDKLSDAQHDTVTSAAVGFVQSEFDSLQGLEPLETVSSPESGLSAIRYAWREPHYDGSWAEVQVSARLNDTVLTPEGVVGDTLVVDIDRTECQDEGEGSCGIAGIEGISLNFTVANPSSGTALSAEAITGLLDDQYTDLKSVRHYNAPGGELWVLEDNTLTRVDEYGPIHTSTKQSFSDLLKVLRVKNTPEVSVEEISEPREYSPRELSKQVCKSAYSGAVELLLTGNTGITRSENGVKYSMDEALDDGTLITATIYYDGSTNSVNVRTTNTFEDSMSFRFNAVACTLKPTKTADEIASMGDSLNLEKLTGMIELGIENVIDIDVSTQVDVGDPATDTAQMVARISPANSSVAVGEASAVQAGIEGAFEPQTPGDAQYGQSLSEANEIVRRALKTL